MTRTTAELSAAKDSYSSVWPNPRRPRRLLAAAAVFHIVVTVSVYALGRSAAFPRVFDTNGIAVSFARDGALDRPAMIRLSEKLREGEIRSWVSATYPFHFKLYSLCFAIFGPALGFTILAAEPLNALCYLGSLILIFSLGQEAFNRSAGLLAAVTVGLWPSFLLHTTQLLRDPLFVIGMLALILITMRLLSRRFSWPRALAYGAGGGCLAIFLWFTRDNMGELMIATAFLGAAMLILRQLIERQLLTTNSIGLMLLLVMAVNVSRVVPKLNDPIASETSVRGGELTEVSNSDQVGFRAAFNVRPAIPSWNLPMRVMRHRAEFIRYYPDATSTIDRNVQLRNKADLIRYLPRAAMIGLFAPFPNMWLGTGAHVGSSGRMLSGFETVAMYVVEGFALVGLWRGRRRLSTWYLSSVAAMGIVALGLVVVNIGALYRLRYIFLILLITLAAEGALQTLDWWKKKPAVGLSTPAQSLASQNPIQ